MGDVAEGAILALVPHRMKFYLEALEAAAPCSLKQVSSIEEFVHISGEQSYEVILIPARGFTSEQWWSLWGSVNSMEPHPSILVYAIRSDFEMWSSVLEAGGYDVIVAPFTETKLRFALQSAAQEFAHKMAD